MPTARDIKIVRWVLILLLTGLAARALVRWYEEPVISVNYVEKLNELRRPEGFNFGDDGANLLEKASMIMKDRLLTGYRDITFNDANEQRWFVLRTPMWPGDMNDVDQKHLRAWLAQNQQVLGMFEYATGQQYCWFELKSHDGDMEYMRQSDLYGAHALGVGLLWRAKVRAADGDVKGGLDDLVTTCQASRHYTNLPSFMEWWAGANLVQMSCVAAVEMAARAKLTSQDLARLAEVIETSGRPYCSLGSLLEWNRFYVYDRVQRCFSDNGHGDGQLLVGSMLRQRRRAGGNPTVGIVSVADFFDGVKDIAGIIYTTDGRKTLLAKWDNVLDQTRELGEVPLWQLDGRYKSRLDALDDQFKKNDFLTMILGFSPLSAIVRAPQEKRVVIEGTLATIAVLRYKADKGTLPQAWADVVNGGYLKEVPIDGYSGQPFVYEKTDDGFRLSSIGKDTTRYNMPERRPIVFWPVEEFKGQLKGTSDAAANLRDMAHAMAARKPNTATDPNE
jgi:hypothetical protein